MWGCGKKEAEQQVKKEIEISEVTVDEKENVDAFEDLTVEFDGWSGQGTITVNTDNCRDKVKNNIKFEYDITQNGTLSNDDIITVYASAVGEGITLTKESCEYTVEGLRELNNVENFSDGVAWYTYTDTQEGKSYLACMDSNGNTLFQFENCLSNHTCFMNDRAMIVFEDGVTVGSIDKSGEILKTISGNDLVYICDEYYVDQEHIADFDNNYYIYAIYNNMGEIVFKERREEQATRFSYAGNDVMEGTFPDEDNCYFLESDVVIGKGFLPSMRSLKDFLKEGGTVYEMGEENVLHFVDSSWEEVERVVEIDNFEAGTWTNGEFKDGVVVLYNEEEKRIGYYDYEKDKFVEGTGLLGDYMEKINFNFNELEYSNGLISFILEGANGESYVASFDKNWEIVFGPMKGWDIYSLKNGFQVAQGGELILRNGKKFSYNPDYYAYYNSAGEHMLDSGSELSFSGGIAYIEPFQWIDETWNTIFDTISVEGVPTIKIQERESQMVEPDIVGTYKRLNEVLIFEENGKMKWVNSVGEEFESEYYKENDMWRADIQIYENSESLSIMQDEWGNLLTYGDNIWGSVYFRKQ